jgi:cell wall-associated NlpC family hydrolase
VKRKLRFVFVVAMTIAMSTAVVRGTQEQEESFGDKLKKLFIRPTPTPKPRKKKRVSPTSTVSPSPLTSASESPFPSPSETPPPPITPLPSASAIVSAAPSATPRPSATIETRPATSVQNAQTQYFEPVRPISPGPRSRRRPSPTITVAPRISPLPTTPLSPTGSPTPVMTLTPTETPDSRPMPSLPPMIKPAPSPSPSPTIKPSPPPFGKKAGTPNVTIGIADISDSQNYSPEIKRVADLGLNLATQNLGYKINSADPAGGGMDSSGFVYHVLSQSGIKDVPRDAREQYVWVRKAGNFQAVLSQRDDSFELDALKPGDLLFWVTPYNVSREPDIIETMIFIGRDKATNQRLMVGASEGRSYKGQMRKGVSVFDFKIGRTASKASKEPSAVFVGYGHVPGLGAK